MQSKVLTSFANVRNRSFTKFTLERSEGFKDMVFGKNSVSVPIIIKINMAEIELAALSKQCLDRRIPDMETLEREAKAWAEERNRKRITVNWQFTNDKAREKFARFYPNLS